MKRTVPFPNLLRVLLWPQNHAQPLEDRFDVANEMPPRIARRMPAFSTWCFRQRVDSARTSMGLTFVILDVALACQPLSFEGGMDGAGDLGSYTPNRTRALVRKEMTVGILDKFGKKDEKPKADFSNVQSGSSSTAAEPAAKPLPDLGPTGTGGPAARDDSYVVVAGDSLSKIAKRQYGDMNLWRRIYEANRDQIKDPDLIHPGQKLRIPRG